MCMGLAAPYRLSCVETGKRMWDGALLLNLLPRCVCVCPSGVGSSPALHHGASSSVQACLGRAGRGSGTKRSQASVNGSGPVYRTRSLPKPQGTSWQRTSLAAVRAHQRTRLCQCRMQIHTSHLRLRCVRCLRISNSTGQFVSVF